MAQEDDTTLPWVQVPIILVELEGVREQNAKIDWKSAARIQPRGWKVDFLNTDFNIPRSVRNDLLNHIRIIIQQEPFVNGQWPKGSKNIEKRNIFNTYFSVLKDFWAKALGIDPDSKRFQDHLYEAVRH
jgi:hypothetical protein